MLPMASCLPAFSAFAFGFGETGSASAFGYGETCRLRRGRLRLRLRLRRQVFALVESFPPGFAAASAAPH